MPLNPPAASNVNAYLDFLDAGDKRICKIKHRTSKGWYKDQFEGPAAMPLNEFLLSCLRKAKENINPEIFNLVIIVDNPEFEKAFNANKDLLEILDLYAERTIGVRQSAS